MKKQLLGMLLFLWPLHAEAQTINPDVGCFVLQGTSFCFEGPVGCDPSDTVNFFLYGYTVADLCQRLRYNNDGWNQCFQTGNDAIAAYNSELAKYNSLVGSYNVLFDAWTKQKKLVSKLRKKCGNACKGIK